MIVKPALKLSAARIVDRPVALERVAGEVGGRVLVQPVIDDEFHGLGGLAYQGRLVATMRTRYLRLWPQPCGTVAAAETLPPDDELEARVAHLLRDYDGPFHLDFVGRYLLDVNPRIHATLPLAIRGGANIVTMYCDLLQGRSVPSVRVAAGLRFRWMEGDLRSVLWNAAARDGDELDARRTRPEARDRSQLRLDNRPRSDGRARPLHVPPGERRCESQDLVGRTRHDVVEWGRNVDVERSLTAGHDVSPRRHLARELGHGNFVFPRRQQFRPTFEDDEQVRSRQQTTEPRTRPAHSRSR